MARRLIALSRLNEAPQASFMSSEILIPDMSVSSRRMLLSGVLKNEDEQRDEEEKERPSDLIDEKSASSTLQPEKPVSTNVQDEKTE